MHINTANAHFSRDLNFAATSTFYKTIIVAYTYTVCEAQGVITNDDYFKLKLQKFVRFESSVIL